MATDAKRFEAKVEAFWLFRSIEKTLGNKEAVRIFKETAKHGKNNGEFDAIGMTKGEFQDRYLVAHYDMMVIKSVPDLYKAIKEMNGRLPRQQRIGHTQSPAAFERHMSRLLSKR